MSLAALDYFRTGPAQEQAPESDPALLSRFVKTGDQGAFAALVRAYGPTVLGVCRRILRDDHAAEDAFQTVFMVLAGRAAEVTRPESLGAWLYGVALRVSLKARSRRAPVATGEPIETATNPDPTADLAAVELRALLDEELAELSDAERSLLVLIYLDGKTHDEAARAVGCPIGSVAWRLDRARESLRKRLARRGVALSLGGLLLLASTGRATAVEVPLVELTLARVERAHPGGAAPRPAAGDRGRLLAVAALLGLFASLAAGASVLFGSSPAASTPVPAARGASPGAAPCTTSAAPAAEPCSKCKSGPD